MNDLTIDETRMRSLVTEVMTQGHFCTQVGTMHAIQQELALLNQNYTQTKEISEKHNEALYGNGTPGILTRLDRQEQSMKAIERLAWTIIGILMTLIFGAVAYAVVAAYRIPVP